MLPYDFFVEQELLFVYDPFLDKQQCYQICEEMRQAPFDAAQMYNSELSMHRNEEMRKTNLVYISAQTRLHLEEKLMTLLPTLNQHYGCRATELEKVIHFLHYQTGDYFKLHSDWHDDWLTGKNPIATRRRLLSFVLFLNEPYDSETHLEHYQGGSLFFYRYRQMGEERKLMGLPLLPKTGLLITFRPETLHEVTLLTSGHRYTVVGWFQ